mmetsp:Transcript_41695/g.116179  ORF Transcript_41695/g.116179 Transcript_41695/m.116179 type:complete len:208 (+) Transcript_41695:496-1119(+)
MLRVRPVGLWPVQCGWRPAQRWTRTSAKHPGLTRCPTLPLPRPRCGGGAPHGPRLWGRPHHGGVAARGPVGRAAGAPAPSLRLPPRHPELHRRRGVRGPPPDAEGGGGCGPGGRAQGVLVPAQLRAQAAAPVPPRGVRAGRRAQHRLVGFWRVAGLGLEVGCSRGSRPLGAQGKRCAASLEDGERGGGREVWSGHRQCTFSPGSRRS